MESPKSLKYNTWTESMCHLKNTFLLVFVAFVNLSMYGQPSIFTHIDAFDGLSDNEILHILQLSDGRMIFTTPRTINIFDGAQFRYFQLNKREEEYALTAYKGAYHVYVDQNDRVWMKNYGTLACFELGHEQYSAHPQNLIRGMNASNEHAIDFFIDSKKTIWLMNKDNKIWNTKRKQLLQLPNSLGELQDLDVIGNHAYFFFSSGKVVCANMLNGNIDYISGPYNEKESRLFDKMSLVVKAPDGKFYQIRNGKEAVCLVFDPQKRRWKKLLQTPYILHTLIVPSKENAYITCGKGLWKLDLTTMQAHYQPSLLLAGGGSVVTDINTIFVDTNGGWWLGTSKNGLLYGHPWRDVFAINKQAPISTHPFKPLWIGLSVEGKTISIEHGIKGALLRQSPSFTHHLELNHNQNTLVFDFSAMNYALPMQTFYRYRLISKNDSTWHTAFFSSKDKNVDGKGILHLSFSRLKPGYYRLQVTASNNSNFSNGPMTEVTFHINRPWWMTPLAYIVYTIFAICIVWTMINILKEQTKRKKKEQELLERIKQLIERCKQYEVGKNDKEQISSPTIESSTPLPDSRDNEFLQKSVALVKAHLDTPYTVEQLSRDLCMERTGLYKKLTSLLDQSPSLFIRNIRLQQAAQLLLEKYMPISEIASKTGFSSSSYFSKCFQDTYGCKPSEYVEKQQKST